MTVVTLGIVFCDTGKVSTKEERLDWPVTEEERNSDKGWGRFGKGQICRLKIRRMKEERAKDLVVRPWCISEKVDSIADSKKEPEEEVLEGMQEDVYSFGNTDYTSGFWTAFSKYYVVPG